MPSLCVRFAGAGCAAILSWTLACAGAAQELSRGQAAWVTAAEPRASVSSAGLLGVRRPLQPLLWAAFGSTAAFATSLALSEGLAYKAASDRTTALARSMDARLDFEARLRASEQASEAQRRVGLLDRVSSVCLAGSIAATGTMLLIWLTGRERKRDRSKYLLGPMVLRRWAGAGLVLREKF